MNKSMHFLLHAANQNNSCAQYFLGYLYSTGEFVDKNMMKGINFYMRSAYNGYYHAYFAVGYFFHEGRNIKRDLQRAIHFYKEASSFNGQFAKNNL